jgi:hypothetical protein
LHGVDHGLVARLSLARGADRLRGGGDPGRKLARSWTRFVAQLGGEST